MPAMLKRWSYFLRAHSDWLRIAVFALPGVLLLVGGRSPEHNEIEDPRSLGELLATGLYPDNWATLIVCSILLCLPGWLLYRGADYLAEITFFRVPLRTTPAIIWRILGYVIAVGAAFLALQRVGRG